MRRLSVVVTLSLLSLLAATLAWAVQVDGRVVDQNGTGQSEVKVELVGAQLYSTWTDEDGHFTIDNVAAGEYKVKVTGSEETTFDVVIDGEGMKPNVLVVDW